MFENWNRQRKIKAYRGNNVTLKNYDSASRTVDLTVGGSWPVHLGFDLLDFDQKLQLAFSGDLITGDGEALSRVMKVLWNSPLPDVFSSWVSPAPLLLRLLLRKTPRTRSKTVPSCRYSRNPSRSTSATWPVASPACPIRWMSP